MNRIEEIENKNSNLNFIYQNLPDGLKGFTIDKTIFIDKKLNEQEKYQIICEEIEHSKLSVGQITNYSENEKQEYKARKSSIKMSINQKKPKNILKKQPENDYEVAEELDVSIDYLHKSRKIYELKYKY